MKKLFTLLTLGLCSLSFAQFSFSYRNGAEIPNGAVIAFGTHSQPSAELQFHITNTTSTEIDVRIKCLSITNATGVGFQLCYGGLCHDNIVAGGIYPDYQFFIEPGDHNGNFDYFVNNNPGDGQVQEYLFEIYALDLSGFPIGQTRTFTYKYDQNLSSPVFESLKDAGVTVHSTVIEQVLGVQVENKTSLEVYNINGQLVKTYSLQNGNHQLEFNHLNSGVYLARFHTADFSHTLKLIKK